MIPVPMPGLLLSVRALAPGDLFTVVACAYRKMDPTNSWPPDALRAYGIAALREIDVRGLDHGLTNAQIGLLCGGLERGARKLTGRVPSVLVRYQSPSWAKYGELLARHRASLLRGPYKTHYQKQGWREQLDIEGAIVSFNLPPHDPTAPVVRWKFDTSKDW